MEVEAEETSPSTNANEKRSRKRFQPDPSWKRQRCPKWHADRGCPGPVTLWRAGLRWGGVKRGGCEAAALGE